MMHGESLLRWKLRCALVCSQKRATRPFDELEIDYTRPWRRATYDELLVEYAGASLSDPAGMREKARRLGVDEAGRADAVVAEGLFDAVVERHLIQPTFVIDAYTHRIFFRHNWCAPDFAYDDLQRLCGESLSQKPRRLRLDYWRDYHAQLVLVGKDYCRPRQPRCDECPLRELLPQ